MPVPSVSRTRSSTSRARADPIFAKRGGVGVVFQDHVRAQAALDLVADRNAFKIGQIVRSDNDPFVQEYETRHADAHANQIVRAAALLTKFDDGIGHVFEHGLAPLRELREPRDLPQHLARPGDGRRAQVGSP